MNMNIGTTHCGTVVRKETFGVFVSIKGLRTDGLVHVSRLRGNSQELRNERLRNIEVGAEIMVEISDTVKKGRLTRIALSEKRVHDALVLHHIPLNEAISGIVTGKKDYGVFVTLPEWGVSGLLHVSRINAATRYERNATLERMAIGDQLTVYVMEIELKDDILKLTLSQIERHDEDVQLTGEGTDENGEPVDVIFNVVYEQADEGAAA